MSHPTKTDMNLIRDLFGEPAASSIPLSFCLGRKSFRGVPEDFRPEKSETKKDGIRETVITGERRGIALRVEVREYTDFPVIEWQAAFENRSGKPSPILSKLYAADLVLPARRGILHHGNGDTRKTDGFAFWDDPIGTEPTVMAPLHGLPCEGAFPFFRIRTGKYIVSVAIGWPAEWQASVSKVRGGIKLTAGEQRVRTKLLPGERFLTPRMTFLVSEGDDESRSVNLWRQWYFRHVLPGVFGKDASPRICLHLFADNGPEFTGTTTKTQLQSLKQYIKRGLKPDIWWFDAGWYPGDGQWAKVGTCEADPERFPENGLEPIGKLCEKNGVDFMLWFEPDRVRPGTWLAEHRPEWLLYQKDPESPDGICHQYYHFDLGNPEARQWMTDRVDALIKAWHVTIYRQDCNRVDFLQIWKDNEPKDRIGSLENRYVQGYLAYWDALRERNPGLWIDCCASGGRRNDLETLRRAVPLHYTDVAYGNHPIKQLQHQAMFEWIPYFRAHTKSWDNEAGTYDPKVEHEVVDEYAYLNALTPAVTVMTRFDAADAEFDLAKKMLPVWHRAAEIELRGDYYLHRGSKKSPRDLVVSEFSDPDRGDGFVLVIRNTLCPKKNVSVKLHVQAEALYRLENGVTHETVMRAGEELSKGFEVALPKRSAEIWFWEKVSTQTPVS